MFYYYMAKTLKIILIISYLTASPPRFIIKTRNEIDADFQVRALSSIK